MHSNLSVEPGKFLNVTAFDSNISVDMNLNLSFETTFVVYETNYSSFATFGTFVVDETNYLSFAQMIFCCLK